MYLHKKGFSTLEISYLQKQTANIYIYIYIYSECKANRQEYSGEIFFQKCPILSYCILIF